MENFSNRSAEEQHKRALALEATKNFLRQPELVQAFTKGILRFTRQPQVDVETARMNALLQSPDDIDSIDERFIAEKSDGLWMLWGMQVATPTIFNVDPKILVKTVTTETYNAYLRQSAG